MRIKGYALGSPAYVRAIARKKLLSWKYVEEVSMPWADACEVIISVKKVRRENYD